VKRTASSTPRVAIVHEWITLTGGSERVVEQIHALFPGAPIFTALVDERTRPEWTRDWKLVTSFLQRVPFAARNHRFMLPLMPLAFEQFDLSEFDLVISSNTACAKGVIPASHARHVSYCHTPCRYIWDLYHEYTRGRMVAPFFAPIAHWLRVWDVAAAQRVDSFVANSEEVAQRIRSRYRRSSTVITPPVDVERMRPSYQPPEDFYLVLSRLVPYKRVELAIEAANRLGRRLVVAGGGPQERELRQLAGPTVEFLGWVSDAEVGELMRRCRALLFPGWEDFGMTPVEAQAAGRPVIAYRRGGATETIRDGETGIFFDVQEPEALVQAIERFETMDFDSRACRHNAERHSIGRFRREMHEFLEREVGAALPVAPEALGLGLPTG
jgi:glycosyltransferase involved in cell wall biosynthesis